MKRNSLRTRAGRLAFLLAASLLVSSVPSYRAFAEEYSEEEYSDDGDHEEEQVETEFIPDEYYDAIESNAVPDWPQGEAVQAGGASVIDLDTGTFLYLKNGDRKFYPASITKILTTLIACEKGNLSDLVTCGTEVNDLESDAASLYAEEGEQFTLEDLLYGVMLASANEMANTVAVHIAGSVPAFADMMNAKAEELGCTGSHFVNPNGLHDDDHYTTAHDYALIAAAAYQNETFRKIASTTVHTIPATNKRDEERAFQNHHRMILKDTGYYQEWATGGKTGFTTPAWNTLVTFGEKDGRRLACVVLHENGGDRALAETTDLMNYGFDQFAVKAVTQDEKVPTFYEILGRNKPESPYIYRSEKLDQKVYTVTQPGIVTVPKDTDLSALTAKATGAGVITYYMGNWAVGNSQISFTQFPTDITYPYEQYRDMDKLFEDSALARQTNEITETATQAWQNVVDLYDFCYAEAKEYVDNNRMTVLLVGALVMLLLLIMIIILIMRCTRDSRIQRKRRQTELQMQRRAEEIERKSALEIEAELREAMAAEEERKREEQKKADDERDFLDELTENERIVDQANSRK